MTPLRINLEQEEIPTHWYNVVADLANPPASEPWHAIRFAIDEALMYKITGKLEGFDYPAESIAESLKHLPKVG